MIIMSTWALFHSLQDCFNRPWRPFATFSTHILTFYVTQGTFQTLLMDHSVIKSDPLMGCLCHLSQSLSHLRITAHTPPERSSGQCACVSVSGGRKNFTWLAWCDQCVQQMRPHVHWRTCLLMEESGLHIAGVVYSPEVVHKQQEQSEADANIRKLELYPWWQESFLQTWNRSLVYVCVRTCGCVSVCVCV